ncbi:gamma-interferon-inducible lysosomal thiol reductase-like isoform X2 [Homarus americanus]|uniref:gamma-interferon-inducible lysosomal thiol reductase-like isoform X2 n=1 Tax=Homarus americanus TaxID=6706 RepID=UPI001C479E73|nr:gamma-interferon-inducible lysosomal thiol reductase-like isoform X2 [Homarus americanus]
MDMGGGRLIRLMIVVLVVVLIWKVWDYSDLPTAEAPPNFKVGEALVAQTKVELKESEEKGKPSMLVAPVPTPQEELEVPVYPTLHVEVYYEALCPDSRYFIMKQLTPAYEKLHKIMHIALVPYGKARTQEKDGKFIFDCQHGPVECRANMVHACVTNLVKEEAKQLAIVHCMIDKNDAPMKIGQKCVEKYSENWEDVESCVLSDKGSSIMKHMGDMTNNLKPHVSFIPTITIDRSQDDQKHILQDLHKILCKRFKGPKQPSC